ncbi:DUF4231 domain-containing protein [Rhodococcus sp. NPDC076796]|uniref:DUF4231 domain-containing protein n=1 Tax=Rhodococcus sp. NPDC076796 TaxID=3154859 RepID=UPI002AD794FE|nr:DUF4231 domain-containing protein [Rhodococcus sp. (in: high G+C Gram-positive bacteria)]
MSAGLTDGDLPGVWREADRSSLKGQRLTLRLVRAKVCGGVFAAVGGALTWKLGHVDLAAVMILLGFAAALVSETTSWICNPERKWYDGRAVAESVKTLAWRYAVGADPFPAGMPPEDAEEEMRRRISRITQEINDVVVFETSDVVITPQMDGLRGAPFTEQRDAYVDGRTIEQKRWYAKKARYNMRQAQGWRLALTAAEILAVMLAIGKLFGGWQIDAAGLFAAIIGAGAAWVAVKQFAPLASAYSVATNELGIQAGRLRSVEADRWPVVAADAEEAISREHTTWLASRTGRPAHRPDEPGQI